MVHICTFPHIFQSRKLWSVLLSVRTYLKQNIRSQITFPHIFQSRKLWLVLLSVRTYLKQNIRSQITPLKIRGAIFEKTGNTRKFQITSCFDLHYLILNESSSISTMYLSYYHFDNKFTSASTRILRSSNSFR